MRAYERMLEPIAAALAAIWDSETRSVDLGARALDIDRGAERTADSALMMVRGDMLSAMCALTLVAASDVRRQ